MRRLMLAVAFGCCLGFTIPAMGAEPEKYKPSIPDEVSEAWERLQQLLQDWGERFRQRFAGRETAEDRPVISQMLNNKDYLGLSPEQIKKLEQLRDSFERQRIRNDADARIVELDIASLLDSSTVDLPKVEAKIREAEKLRADLRIARIKIIEQAKAVLNPEQRKKFHEGIESHGVRPPPRTGPNPPAKE